MPVCASAPDCSKAQHDKLLLCMRVDGHMTIIVCVHLYICQHTAKVKYASGEAYNGHWQHGQRHGHGKWSSAPKAAPRLAPEIKGPSAAARRADKEVRETYVGGWVAGKREGHGVAEYADGGRCARCAVTTNIYSHTGNFMQCTGMVCLPCLLGQQLKPLLLLHAIHLETTVGSPGRHAWGTQVPTAAAEAPGDPC